MGWVLAIDVGTTSTAAARRVDDRVETIQLKGAPQMPSMVFWREGTGEASAGRLVLGTEADNLSSLAPWCLERAPKSRLGEELILLGDKQIRPVEIISSIMREVLTEARTLSGGEEPSEVRITHPARWRTGRLDRLAEAAKFAGITDPTFVPEPVAAAVHFASARLDDGEHVAVYDLGGGTLDTAVLQRRGDSFEVVGQTGGDEEMGGEDFDDLLYRYLGERLSGEAWERMRTADDRRDRGWAQGNREFVRQTRRAKEGLSTSAQYEFYLPAPIDQEVTATVEEFEELITPTLRLTIAELERTILAAGLQPDEMSAIYLAGGSSRIPQIGRLIEERIGIKPQHLDDPKAAVALGAARMGVAAARESVVIEPPLPEVVPPPPPPLPPPLPPPPGAEGEPLPAPIGVGPQAIEPTEFVLRRIGEAAAAEDAVASCKNCGTPLMGGSAICGTCGRLNPRWVRRGEVEPATAEAGPRRSKPEKSDKRCKSCHEQLDVGRAMCGNCGYLNLR